MDKARLRLSVPTGVKVAGTTQFGAGTTAWFRCRLTVPTRPETPEPAGGRRRVESRPTLLYGIKDATGEKVVLTVESRVEVVSRELGEALWQPDGDPEPLRKKRRVIGWYVPLRRIEEHPFTAVLP